MRVVGLVYDGVASREVLGPIASFESVGASWELQSRSGGACDGFDPYARLEGVPLAPCAPDVLVVPGGFGWQQLAADTEVAAWLGAVAPAARTVLAVSTGSLVLDRLGLTGGRAMTGHWLSGSAFTRSAALSLDDRIVDTGWLVSAAGAVSAMRAATRIAERLTYGPPGSAGRVRGGTELPLGRGE